MKCKKKGHTASYCRSTTPATVDQQTNNGTGRREGRKCYECGEVGHIKKECPKLRSQGGIGRGRAFVIGSREAIQDPSVVSGLSSPRSKVVVVLAGVSFLMISSFVGYTTYIRISKCREGKLFMASRVIHWNWS
ncbi:hypothetical protein Lser_V15G37006 [Lactuca serriola]